MTRLGNKEESTTSHVWIVAASWGPASFLLAAYCRYNTKTLCVMTDSLVLHVGPSRRCRCSGVPDCGHSQKEGQENGW